MNKANRYLFSHFISVFASLFSTLFFILSIIFFVQISRITSIIEISFFELGKLYFFVLPKVFLFTIPISFFVSLALAFLKLSRENEIIVMFTLGYSPNKIAKFFFNLSLLISGLLIITSLFLIPLASELNLNFIDYKKSKANLNIKPTEFGQKFSDWMVFVGSSSQDSKKLEDIVMYYVGNGAKRFVLAKNAKVLNDKGSLKLILNQGKVYDIAKDIIHELSFENMQVTTSSNKNIREVSSVFNYWDDLLTNSKKSRHFITYTLIAIFPTISVFFAISFGIVVIRYQKSTTYSFIFLILFAFFASIMLVTKLHPFLAISLVSSIFMISSLITYKKKVLAYF